MDEPPSGMLLPGYIFLPRGVANAKLEASSWTKKSPPNTIERSLVLLGHTVDEGRLFDVMAVRQYLKKTGKNMADQHLIGRGEAGILAVYAGLLGEMPKQVTLLHPTKTHKEGPHFLNIMRVLDVPEALGLLAPTPLTIVGGMDPAFDRTAEIYRLAGASDKLIRR